MKKFKRIVSSLLAISLAATSIVVVSSVTAATPGDPLKLDPDLNFANYIDFSSWQKDTDLNTDYEGITKSDETTIMYRDNVGAFQVKDGVGVDGTAGLTVMEKLGKEKKPVWATVSLGLDPEDSAESKALNFKQLGALGATEYVFYVDLTNYKKFKLITNPDTDEVTGREPEAKASSYVPFIGLWDLGTSVGEERSAYVPKSDGSVYLQTENGRGGNNWTEVIVKKEGEVVIPKNYKGYVRIPRTSMSTIWGANGDVIADGATPKLGDNLFNGPMEFVTFRGNCGGYEYEGAQKVFDNIGFISYEFESNILTTPVNDVFKEITNETSTPVTSAPPVTSGTPDSSAPATSTEESSQPIQPEDSLKYLNMIDFERTIKDTPLWKDTIGIDKADGRINEFQESEAGAYFARDGVGANGSTGLVMENYLGILQDDEFMYKAGWGVWAMVPTYADPANYTGFTPDLFSAAEIGKATEAAFWIDASQYTKHKLIKAENEDGDDVVVGRNEKAELAAFEYWLGIWDSGRLNNESTTCYAVEKGKNILIQDGENWVNYEQKKSGNVFSLPKGYVGYVRIPRTSMEGIWGAYGDIRPDEAIAGSEKYLEGGNPLPARGDGCFNGPIERIGFNGNIGGYELEGAKVVIDDIGFIGNESNFKEGLTLLDMPTMGKELPSELPSTDDNQNNQTQDETSVDNTKNPNSGSTGMAGMTSALAVAALACTVALVFRKKK